MQFITETQEKTATAKRIVNNLAGSPNELKRQLRINGLRYVKIRKGAAVNYIVRSIKGGFKLIIRL